MLKKILTLLTIIILLFFLVEFISSQENNTQGILNLSSGNNYYGIEVNTKSIINYIEDTTIINTNINKNHTIKFIISNEVVTIVLYINDSKYTQIYNIDNLFIGIAQSKYNTIKINFISDVNLYNKNDFSYTIHRDSYLIIDSIY